MANFKTHLTITIISSTLLVESFLAMGFFTIYEAMVAFILGITGGLLPDIDSNTSKSLILIFNGISLLLTSILLYILLPLYSPIEIIILFILIFTCIQFILIKFIKHITVHRGMIHSIPMAFIFGLSVVLMMEFLFQEDTLLYWVYGFILTINYLIHLTLDELYSVDLTNRRMKKSFGTALKLYQMKTMRHKMTTFMVYLVLVVLWYLSPTYS